MLKKYMAFFTFIMTWIISVPCLAGLHDYPTVAVLNARCSAAISPDIALDDANIVSDFLIDNLLDSNYFMLVERDNLKAILDEQSLSMTGLVDSGTAVSVGKLAGAKYIIYNNIANLSTKESGIGYRNSAYGGTGFSKYTVTANIVARIIDTETGQIVLSGRGKGSSSSSNVEFGLDKRSQSSTIYKLYGRHGAIYGEETTTRGALHTIRIGSAEVSQVQVHNALSKAAEDVIYGDYGLISKLEGKGKKRKSRG